MAMSNAERQRKWIEKNRALHNLRRRNKRKDLIQEERSEARTSKDTVNKAVSEKEAVPEIKGTGPLQGATALSSKRPESSELDRLRSLMKQAYEAPSVPAVKPVIFRDDHGRVISERQWNVLQKLKEKAKAGGYELDDFIQ